MAQHGFVEAVYENGVFRPVGRVELPDNAHVFFEPVSAEEFARRRAERLAIYAVLDRRFEGDDSEVAARHESA